MSDWFDETFGPVGGQKAPEKVEEPEIYEAELVAPEEESNPLVVCRQVQQEVFREALDVIDGALKFANLDDEELQSKEPPDAWIKELGLTRALRAHRLAKAANLPEKLAPAGLKVATNVMLGCLRAQAVEKAGTHTLNVAFVNMSVNERKLPELEIEGEDVKALRKKKR